MGSKGSSAPNPPNYSEIIPQQEASNLRQFNTMLGSSRINSQTPYGRQYWVPPQGFYGGGGGGNTAMPGTKTAQTMPTPSGQPGGQAFDPNMDFAATLASQGPGSYGGFGGQPPPPPPGADQGGPPPGGPGGPPPGYGDANQGPWTFVQELSPEQQGLYNQDIRIRNQMGGTAENLMSGIQGMYDKPVNFSSQLKPWQNVESPQYQQGQYNPYSRYQQQQWGGPQYRTDVGARNDAERAYYNREMAYLEPQLQQQEQRAHDRLIAMGGNPANQDFKNAMQDVYDQQAVQRSVARNNAIVSGGNEATQELQRGIMTEDPRFRAAQSEGQFGYNAGLGENRYGQEFGRGERQFGYGADMQRAQFDVNQQQAANNWDLSRVGQQRLDYTTPMNVLNAFRTGSQVQLPGTPGTASSPNLQGIDYLGTANQQYQNQLGQWNANQASGNNFMNGLFGLGSAWLTGGGGNPFSRG